MTKKQLEEVSRLQKKEKECDEALDEIKELKETMIEEKYKADLLLAETNIKLFSLLSEAVKLDKDNLEKRKEIAIYMCSIEALTKTIEYRDTSIASLTRQIIDAGLQVSLFT